MKNYSKFAPSSPKTDLYSTTCGGYFYGYFGASFCKDKRLSIHNGLPHSCCNLSLARCGEIASPILHTSIFHYMPKTMKNAGSVNNSSVQARPDGTKSVTLEAFSIEMNAKNKAYRFILSNGLFDQYVEFNRKHPSGDPHADCLAAILSEAGP